MASSVEKKRYNASADDEDDVFERAGEDESSKKKQKVTENSKKPSEFVLELGGKKKVTVSQFKGLALVNIREFYNDKVTGEEKPGSKGIALTLQQFNELKKHIAEISDALDSL